MVWIGSTRFGILCEQYYEGLHCLPFSAVWSGSALFAILSLIRSTPFASLNSLIRVYTICHSQQSDQGQGPLSFSVTVWSASILFAILSSLTRVYTVCHSQQSDQGLQYLRFFISSIFKVYTVCHYQQSDPGLNNFPFFKVWSGCTLFAILICLIRVYMICHYQSDQLLHYLPFSEVWSGSTLYAILYKQYYQWLLCFPFSSVYSGSILLPVLCNLIKVKVYTVILRNSLIRVYTICYWQQSDQGLHYLPFSAVWSTSTLLAILNSLIRV